MVTIEQTIIKSLLFNQQYVERVIPYVENDVFDGSYKILFDIYKTFYNKYNKIPNSDAIAIEIQNSKISEVEFEEISNIIGECYSTRADLPDTEWLVKETEDFCKDKKIYNAIYNSINILDDKDGKEKLDKTAIPQLLNEALAFSFQHSIGMEFFEDAEKRYDMYVSEEDRIPFPLEALNIMSNGGLKRKTLSAILAPSNVGKSSLMCFLAGGFLKGGKNVLYISMEMSEDSIIERIDANLLDVRTDDLKHLSKSDFINKVNRIKSGTNGKLYAKEYPTASAHAGNFRYLLKELKQKKGFVPDIVFVDYLNICASARYKSMNGVNSYSYVKAISEELRGLAVEFDICIITATQTNRDGFNAQSLDMTSTSESIGTAQTLDFYIAITQDEVMREQGTQLFHLLKTRWGNKSKVGSQLVGIDFDHMRYYDLNNDNERIKNVAQSVGNIRPKSVPASSKNEIVFE